MPDASPATSWTLGFRSFFDMTAFGLIDSKRLSVQGPD